jgi:hypothetical protein
LKSGIGIYFSELKLTYKGEQAAIQERKRKKAKEEFMNALPEIAKYADSVSAEIERGKD